MAQSAPSNEPERYLAWAEVRPLFGNISRTTAWRGAREGWLPRPVQVSPGRHAWAASEVAAWQADLRPRRLKVRRAGAESGRGNTTSRTSARLDSVAN